MDFPTTLSLRSLVSRKISHGDISRSVCRVAYNLTDGGTFLPLASKLIHERCSTSSVAIFFLFQFNKVLSRLFCGIARLPIVALRFGSKCARVWVAIELALAESSAFGSSLNQAYDVCSDRLNKLVPCLVRAFHAWRKGARDYPVLVGSAFCFILAIGLLLLRMYGVHLMQCNERMFT